MSYTMSGRPAYNSVHVRRGFQQHVPPPPPPPPPPPAAYATIRTQQSIPSASLTPAPVVGKVEWPKTVRDYVQKAFAIENNIEGISKSAMELKLKSIIGDSVKNNTLYSADWERLPLPQQIIVEEQRQQAAMSAITPWGTGILPLSIHDTDNKANHLISRKRKSSELETSKEDYSPKPPWQMPQSTNVFESRISLPDKRQRAEAASNPLSKSQKRKQRLENGHATSGFMTPYSSPVVPSINQTMDEGPVVGRCQILEKKYFRLTAPPKPETVRPLEVLEHTMELLKRKWKQENNYSYMCDQLKSLRQDLTVQHIKTAFTVSVYELHARIALEKGDLGEYNQCQTQLRALYAQHLGGHPQEFKAYRILYFIHTCNRTDMNDVLADLTQTEKAHPAIKHALEIRSALALGNYRKFFRLYLDTSHMGVYLMDMFVGRERLVALSTICISYKPDVKIRFVTEELGFDSDDEAVRFICDHNGQLFLEERENRDVRLLTGKALRHFETAKAAAFQKVDIKGQI